MLAAEKTRESSGDTPIRITMEFDLPDGSCEKALSLISPDNDASVTAECLGGKLIVKMVLKSVTSLFSVPNEIMSQIQLLEEIRKKFE